MEQVKSEEEMGGAMGGASRGEGAELLGLEEKPAGDGVGVSVVEEGWGEQPLLLTNPARQLSSSVQPLSGEMEIETALGRGAGPPSSTPPNSSCRIASKGRGVGVRRHCNRGWFSQYESGRVWNGTGVGRHALTAVWYGIGTRGGAGFLGPVWTEDRSREWSI